MKKIIITLITLTVSVISVTAQNARREIGNMFIDAGTGLSFVSRGSYTMVLPPVKFDAEYALLDFGFGTLSVGAYFSMGIDKYQRYDHSVTTFLAGPMASFHLPVSENVDLFGKLIVGYVGAKSSEPLLNSSIRTSGAGAGIYVGGTWYFSPKMGLGAEFGYGGPTSLGVHLSFRI